MLDELFRVASAMAAARDTSGSNMLWVEYPFGV